MLKFGRTRPKILGYKHGRRSGEQGAVAPLDFHTWYKYSR